MTFFDRQHKRLKNILRYFINGPGRRLARISRKATTVLEIGPFDTPIVVGSNVWYFDVLDAEQLRERAAQIGRNPDSVPTIHYVSADADLSVINRTFQAVVSSHCIEHQPDLVGHLQRVSRLLEVGGTYNLVVPDKRYCFDHFIGESYLQEVLAARGERRHPLQKVIAHSAYTTHNSCYLHWLGRHADANYLKNIEARTRRAVAEFQMADGGYIDVHRWQFTPHSFGHIVDALFDLKLIDLRVVKVGRTPLFGRDFFVSLERIERDGSGEVGISSSRRMVCE